MAYWDKTTPLSAFFAGKRLENEKLAAQL